MVNEPKLRKFAVTVHGSIGATVDVVAVDEADARDKAYSIQAEQPNLELDPWYDAYENWDDSESGFTVEESEDAA
jgi:hypothetical protein